MATPNNNSPLPVATFVFLDLEGTGLNGIGEKPRITEISLVATHRSSLLEQSSRNTPRVINKLTLCLDPRKAIGYEASIITGLYNDVLSLHCPFSESVVDICTLFFEQLPPPVCLLAHNGHKYDFPLLSAELLRIGRHFPADILCVDTLDGFRDVLCIQEVQASILRTRSIPPLQNPAVANGIGSQNQSARRQRPVVRRLVMNETDRAPLSNVTPEMQVVKANDNITNAPMKKPVCKEIPKAVRVSSAKRKLEFGGPSVSDLAKNMVDDVDREDVMDDIQGFHLTPTNTWLEKGADETVSDEGSEGFVLGERPSTLWEDDVADDVLVEAMDEFEQNLQKANSFDTDVMASATPIASTAGAAQPVKSWASVVQGTPWRGANNPKVVRSSPQPSCSNDEYPRLICTTTRSLSPVTSTKPASSTNQRTPTNTVATPLITYPTPPPSEHKNTSTFSSNLSPLATPFVPQSLWQTNQLAFNQGGATNNVLGISMALGSVHKHVLGYEPPDSHRAEDDCMSLLRLSNRLNPWFCDWVDKHATLFSSTIPMYKATKRPKKP